MFSDGTSYKLNETDMNKIQYHVKNCQARYKKTGDISEKKASGKRSHKETFPCSQVISFGGKQKRKKMLIHVAQEINNVLLTARLNIKYEIKF